MSPAGTVLVFKIRSLAPVVLMRRTAVVLVWLVIRISPAPLYNRYSDVLGFVQAVEQWRASKS